MNQNKIWCFSRLVLSCQLHNPRLNNSVEDILPQSSLHRKLRYPKRHQNLLGLGETYILMDALSVPLSLEGFSYFFLRPNNIMPAIKDAITPMISSLDKLP